MSRMARVIVPHIPHHITQRGNRRQRTFFCAADYETYLRFLVASAAAFDFEVWAYCLMPNHVHLLIVPHSAEGLRDGIAQAHLSYTRFINRRQAWQGHLWQGRFFSCPVDPSRAAFVARYIELNPVRAMLCDDAREYLWSSAKHHGDSGAGPFGKSPLDLQVGDWDGFLKLDPGNPKMAADLRTSSRTGRPFGDSAFISDLERAVGRTLAPRKPGPRPRCTDSP